MEKLAFLWQNIRYSLWFVPALTIASALALALVTIDVDARLGKDLAQHWPRLFGANAEGARSILEVIASAMLSVGALTFSITVLVLSMAASQYTPRVIRTFMRSRPNQLVLGVFIGIFVYCLVVLRTIRGGSEPFIPSVSTVIAIGLAIIGVGIRQLVDIALKAMSPAINDSTTAVMCIDYLAAVLVRLAPRCVVPDLCLRNDQVKVITRGASFEQFLVTAFAPIRAHADGNLEVVCRLMQALTTDHRQAAIGFHHHRRHLLDAAIAMAAHRGTDLVRRHAHPRHGIVAQRAIGRQQGAGS